MAPCPILPDGELPPFTVAKLENLGRLGAQVPKAGLEHSPAIQTTTRIHHDFATGTGKINSCSDSPMALITSSEIAKIARFGISAVQKQYIFKRPPLLSPPTRTLSGERVSAWFLIVSRKAMQRGRPGSNRRHSAWEDGRKLKTKNIADSRTSFWRLKILSSR